MDWSAFFDEWGPDDLRVKGTRVGIRFVMYDAIYKGMTPQKIAESYLTLTLADVYAVLLYYELNKETERVGLDNWIAEGERLYDEFWKNPPPAAVKLREVLCARRKAEELVLL